MLSFISIASFATVCYALSYQPGLRGRDLCSGNTPENRQQWCNYDINTNYNWISPDTGVTREYWLEITDLTVAPDGYKRYGQGVNGTIPGTMAHSYAVSGDSIEGLSMID